MSPQYIATYQTKPNSAVTYYAPVAKIEPYGESGKYQLVFSSAPVTITPILLGEAPAGAMQAPRYTTLEKLRAAKTLDPDVLSEDSLNCAEKTIFRTAYPRGHKWFWRTCN